MQMFMKPTGLATKVVGRGSSMVFGVLKRIVGFDLLADLSEFFQAFSGMVDGFQERAKRVNELLADPATSFLVVCGPQGEPIDEAVYFHRKLVEAKLPVGGVIVNKVHYETEADLGDGEVDGRPERASSATSWPGASPPTSPTTRRSPSATPEHRAPRPRARAQGVIRVPYLDEDVHDLEGLLKINRYLFASESERNAMARGPGLSL